jgi:hypothetical protein
MFALGLEINPEFAGACSGSPEKSRGRAAIEANEIVGSEIHWSHTLTLKSY